SGNIKRFLAASDYDIYHANTIWLYPSHVTCKMAREKGRKYVLSPHGMLYPTALKVSAWKKWPMKKLWFDEDIKQAACLHATCEQEMKYIRQYGYSGPVAIIPNPVVFPEGIAIKEQIPVQKRIGYLGRLHPIKKVENLLYGATEAMKQGSEPFNIEIMGRGSEEYETFLCDEVERLGLKEKVHFVGFVNGKEKYEKLSTLWALFVPSAQENFGMIVPEALICGTPVYASLGTPWKELNEYRCGWWRDNRPETIAKVIREVLQKKEDELLAMGSRGRKLMEEKYEQHKVAQMMAELYGWLLGECSKPDFIYE
ncbi:MAG: glycosyltransferase, partial [Bacteroidales bacterium]|nr:glycosyltransferase [Bacteroidales bacterium]